MQSTSIKIEYGEFTSLSGRGFFDLMIFQKKIVIVKYF